MKTYSTKASDIKREWHVIDASDKILGHLATEAARLLMGKHKAIFVRNLDVGDYVVVINAEKVSVTGNKGKQKLYYRHSGYPGGLKSVSLETTLVTYPNRVIEHAVRGMLPHNRLEALMMKRLRVFAGPAHPYGGQAKTARAEAEEKTGA
ncbi:MAG: 50S ribosomal protein L13 [Chloroflexi bacterium]|nr:50S ribosomal protein L13 [Chloroflexota bacterium]